MRRSALRVTVPLASTFALVAFAMLVSVTGCEDELGTTSNSGFDASGSFVPDGATVSTDGGAADADDGGTFSDASGARDAGDAGDAADAADAGPVIVTTTSPRDGRVGVGTAATVSVTFGAPMKPATVTVQPGSGACTGSLQLLEGPNFTSCVGGSVATEDGVTFTFTPAAALAPLVRYKVQTFAAAVAADGRPSTPFAMGAGFRTQKFATPAKVLYLVNASGNLGGIAGADASCTSLVTRPVGVTAAKAMITGPTRTACTVSNCGAGNAQLDWALRPNQHYVRADGAYVFLTNANGIFTAFPGDNDLGSGVNFWNGLNGDWTTRAPTCSDWTTTAGNGAVGFDVVLNSVWLTGGELPCTSVRPIVCAEQ